MEGVENAFSRSLSGLRIASDAEVDSWGREQRKRELRPTWERVPRGMLKGTSDPKLTAAVDDWEPDYALAILGHTGVGKTCSTARLVARLCKLGADHGGDALALARSTFWVDEPELMWAAQNREDSEARRVIDRAHRARVLILDDVSKRSATLDSVLQVRGKHKRVVVLTSGATSVEELAQLLGGQAPYRWFIQSGQRPGKVVIA